MGFSHYYMYFFKDSCIVIPLEDQSVSSCSFGTEGMVSTIFSNLSSIIKTMLPTRIRDRHDYCPFSRFKFAKVRVAS